MKELTKKYAGPLLALLGNICFCIMDSIAQSCTQDGIGPGEVAFGRMLVTLPILSTYIVIRDPTRFKQINPFEFNHSRSADEDNGKENNIMLDGRTILAARLIWLRAIIISVSLCFLYAGLSRIALSEATATISLRITLVALMCRLFLGETFAWRMRLASAISTIAVILIVEPPFLYGEPDSGDRMSRYIGFLFITAFCFGDASQTVVTRAIGPGLDSVVATLAFSIACLVVSPCFMLLTGEIFLRPKPVVYVKLIAAAMTGVAAQVSLVMALQREKGGTVSLIGYSQIVISTIIQSVFLGSVPGTVQGIGMLVIGCSGIWAIMAETREKSLNQQSQEEEENGYSRLPLNDSPIDVRISDHS